VIDFRKEKKGGGRIKPRTKKALMWQEEAFKKRRGLALVARRTTREVGIDRKRGRENIREGGITLLVG